MASPRYNAGMAEVEDQPSMDLLALLAQVQAYAAANGMSAAAVHARLLSLGPITRRPMLATATTPRLPSRQAARG
jgi:hypothetical protein